MLVLPESHLACRREVAMSRGIPYQSRSRPDCWRGSARMSGRSCK